VMAVASSQRRRLATIQRPRIHTEVFVRFALPCKGYSRRVRGKGRADLISGIRGNWPGEQLDWLGHPQITKPIRSAKKRNKSNSGSERKGGGQGPSRCLLCRLCQLVGHLLCGGAHLHASGEHGRDQMVKRWRQIGAERRRPGHFPFGYRLQKRESVLRLVWIPSGCQLV
jgi:hypothetical protein